MSLRFFISSITPFLIGIFASVKLIRLIPSFSVSLWPSPFYISLFFAILGIICAPYFYLYRSRSSRIYQIDLFILLIAFFGILQKIIFPLPDSYLLGTLLLLSYPFFRLFFCCEYFHSKQFFDFLFFLLGLFSLIELSSYIFGFSLFDWKLAYKLTGSLEHTGSSTITFFDIVGRPPGLTGSSYGSASLLASISVYFYSYKRYSISCLYFLMSLCHFSPSSCLFPALFIFASGIKLPRVHLFSLFVPILFLILFFAIYTFKTYQLSDLVPTLLTYLPSLSLPFDITSLFSQSLTLFTSIFIGNGLYDSPFAFGEIRVFNLLFTIGLVPIFFLLFLFNKIYYLYTSLCSKLFNSHSFLPYFRVSICFISLIFLNSWHYPTFYSYPNFLICLALFSQIISISEFLACKS